MKGNSFRCINCDSLFVLTDSTCRSVRADYKKYGYEDFDAYGEAATVAYFKCPGCGYVHIKLYGEGHLLKDKIFNIRPISDARVFPDYIPEPIRKDYEEAYSILNYSPRASAVLARRCLQAIIRDIYKPKTKRDLLWEEIESIKSEIPNNLYRALNAVRNVGNIGAHPESDVLTDIKVSPEEAKQLLLVIELLFKSLYIDKRNEDDLITKVIGIGEEKKEQKENAKAEAATKA